MERETRKQRRPTNALRRAACWLGTRICSSKFLRGPAGSLGGKGQLWEWKAAVRAAAPGGSAPRGGGAAGQLELTLGFGAGKLALPALRCRGGAWRC